MQKLKIWNLNATFWQYQSKDLFLQRLEMINKVKIEVWYLRMCYFVHITFSDSILKEFLCPNGSAYLKSQTVSGGWME